MCEVSEKIYQEGIERGIERGMARGIAKGKLEKEKEIARSLSKTGMPLEKIAEVLKVNVQMVQEWLIGNTAKTM